TIHLLRGRVHVAPGARQDLISSSGKELARYSARLRNQLVDLGVMNDALVARRGEDGAAKFLRRLGRRADVYVDPRYGIWHRVRAQICAPTGCPAAATSGG